MQVILVLIGAVILLILFTGKGGELTKGITSQLPTVQRSTESGRKAASTDKGAIVPPKVDDISKKDQEELDKLIGEVGDE
jgi:hypothetical protein